jgi:TRAP-type C4-dicarboxylate transport system permease small subunit
MRSLRDFLTWLGVVELYVAVAAFVLVVGLSGLQIVLRSVFNTSILWGQEVAQLGMLVSYFFGAAYIYKRRQYMLVEFFVQRLGLRAQMILYLFAQALTFVFAALLVAQILEIAPAQLRMRTFLLRIPRFYSSLPLLIASLSIALSALYYALAVVATGGLRGAVESVAALEAATRPRASRLEQWVAS